MSSAESPVSIMWFRRDLRLTDNAAFYHALISGRPVVPVFIFDRAILDQLEDRKDARVTFIYEAISNLKNELKKHHSDLEVFYGFPQEAFTALLKKYRVEKVFANRDYEQYALDRDEAVRKQLLEAGTSLKTYKDQVIFEAEEVKKEDGSSYSVFTPYKRRWMQRLTPFYLKPYPCVHYFRHLHFFEAEKMPSLDEMNFGEHHPYFPPADFPLTIIDHYHQTRDYPGITGTSRLSIHLRFGTISIRALAAEARERNEVFLNELIWRDFYQMILETSEAVRRYKSFKPAYDHIPWRNNESEFERWCQGETGYPLVDAGMRQMNETGYMHNRLRMITASFLCKHLLIDWRWGESYFAKKLLDYDFASNNGGWQWAAGSGCDAAPYFRIFNPQSQQEKFDKQMIYTRKWVKEVEGPDYPLPMVVHEEARKRALDVYKTTLDSFKDR